MCPWTSYNVTSSCLGYVRASTDLPLMASGICTKQKTVSASSAEQWMMCLRAQTKDLDLWMGSTANLRMHLYAGSEQKLSALLHSYRLRLRILTRGKSLKLMIWRGMLVRTELYLQSPRNSVMPCIGYHADNAEVANVLPSMTTANCLVSIKQRCMHSCQLSSGPDATYKLLWTCRRSGLSPSESSSKSSL